MAALGSTPGIIVGVGVGTAVSAAIEPALEVAKQEAWKRLPNRVNNPELIARLVAQGGMALGHPSGDDPGTAYEAAKRHGFESDKLDQLIYLAQTTPDVAAALHLWRRGFISPELWTHVLRKHGLDARYFPGLNQSYWDILSPGELSAAIHRGLVPDPQNLLRGEQPKPPFHVEAYPVYDINAKDEAEGHGFDLDHLGVLVGLQGLPMGTHEAAQAFYKGIITHGDYIRAFNESNSRNEWAQAVLDNVRQIPTARDFMENALRGHHDFEWAAKQAERHGMERDDAFLIYQNQGRPLNLHQISQGLAWGGKYEPGKGDNPDPWFQAVLLGAVRPEYYDLQRHLKYNLPSAFYFRSLQEQDVISEPEAATWYKRLGWPPDLAEKVAKAYATDGGTAKMDARVRSAQTSAINALKKRFMLEQTDEQGVINGLEQAGVTTANAQQILDFWILERLWTEKPLTPANVKKAYKANELAQDEAVARLVDQQWSAADAQIYLTT